MFPLKKKMGAKKKGKGAPMVMPPGKGGKMAGPPMAHKPKRKKSGPRPKA